MSVLLVGAGPMSIEYAKVLREINIDFEVIGRGIVNAEKFKKEIGIEVKTGGIEKWLNEVNPKNKDTIVAVNENLLGDITIKLMQKGIKRLLVEKPGGFDFNNIANVEKIAKTNGAEVYVGYNRRFYSSVIEAKKIILEDDGVKSFNFEFTEWSHVIKDLIKNPGVKENWFLHNSTHVVDLAFFLGGKPKEISTFTSGSLEWHPSASIFAGAGISENGALFSYQANWEAPGRWGVEVLTRKHRLILRPLESLQIQEIGSIVIDQVTLEDKLDQEFKPGLFLQTKAFLENNFSNLCTIEYQETALEYFSKISGYHANKR